MSTEYFENKINNCRPDDSAIEVLNDDLSQFELHMTLFEVYSYISLMYAGTYLQRLPPCSIRQQCFLLQCIERIDVLIDTPMLVSLSMLLMVVGINCCYENDRIGVRRRLEYILKKYGIGNFFRMIKIVEESWKANPNGTLWIDWAEIARSKGWLLYVG